MTYGKLLSLDLMLKGLLVYLHTEQVAIHPEESVDSIGGGTPREVLGRPLVHSQNQDLFRWGNFDLHAGFLLSTLVGCV